MNRTEYMNELEFLLQDIPDEEKADALAYYRDYLEEAGDENEADAIREFGSPERVAAIIRADLSGSLENGGEFTEAGYQDERFRDPGYQMAPHRPLPDVRENGKSGAGKKTGSGQQGNDPWIGRAVKVLLLLGVLAILSPIILGIGGGAVGIVAGVLALIVAAVLLVGILTIAACIAAVALMVSGIGMLFVHPLGAVVVLGIGVLVLGFAFIGIALSVLVYGTFLPFCVRGAVNLVSGLFHRERRKQA